MVVYIIVYYCFRQEIYFFLLKIKLGLDRILSYINNIINSHLHISCHLSVLLDIPGAVRCEGPANRAPQVLHIPCVTLGSGLLGLVHREARPEGDGDLTTSAASEAEASLESGGGEDSGTVAHHPMAMVF